MRRLGLAVLAALALALGCGSDDPAPPPAGLSNAEQATMADLALAADFYCDDGAPDPEPLIEPALRVGARAPEALLDDGSGLTVRETLARAAADLRPCAPALAARLNP
jgi:hypothetical protein